MSSSNKLASLLNIQQHEWPLVKLLFVLQFLQGASIALFFTSAISQFLDKFPISELTYVFLISAAILWLTGILCNKLEHQFNLYKLSIILTVIMTSIIFFFWIGKYVVSSNWFLYFMLSFFNVLYLINNLEFWGLSAQLYNVRQSKRLFGIISSGDIPAKFLGYTIAILLVPFMGTQNLMVIAFFLMLFSLYFLRIIFNSLELKKLTSHITKIKQHHTAGVSALIKLFTENKLIIRTAVLSMLAFTGFVLVEYAFYAEVKESNKYKDDEAFATFTALFMGGARLVSWLFKFGLEGRFLNAIGNRNALLITPVALFIFSTAILFIFNLNLGQGIILYVFGCAAILVDALRASINSPVLLTILQSLSTPDRLRSHNIVKGVMDPFAYLIIGLLLYFLYHRGIYSLVILSYVLIGISILWAISVFLVQREYLKLLIKTISSRYFKNEDLKIYEKGTLEKITQKINNGTELEVLYILKMLEKGNEKINHQLIQLAFNHSSDAVCYRALELVEKKNITAAASDLVKLISQKSNSDLKAKAIKVHSSINYNYKFLSGFLLSEDLKIKSSALESVILNSVSLSEKTPVIRSLKEMFASPDQVMKLSAIRIAAEVDESIFSDELILMLKNSDSTVIKAAIKAIGLKASASNLTKLIPLFEPYEKEVTDAFFSAGNISLSTIKNMLFMGKLNKNQREILILTLGRIGGENAQLLLIQLLPEFPTYSHIIIKALNRSGYHISGSSEELIDTITNNYLIRSVEILFMLNRLLSAQKIRKTLFNSLLIELDDLRDSLLNLFSFYSEKKQIDKIKQALQLNKKENASIALELIEVTIKKDHASTFNIVFEDSDISFRCNSLKKLMPKTFYSNIEKVVTRVLNEEEDQFNHWTKACSLHTCKLIPLTIDSFIISRYLRSDNLLLKETAAYAIS